MKFGFLLPLILRLEGSLAPPRMTPPSTPPVPGAHARNPNNGVTAPWTLRQSDRLVEEVV